MFYLFAGADEVVALVPNEGIAYVRYVDEPTEG
jgi:hypothetical protein